MGNALQWFRRRQIRLARVLLAAVCAAWLQFAILPCTMVHAAAPVDRQDHGQEPASSQASVEPAAPCHDMPVDDTCLYCLGDEPGRGCDYPHEARTDLRDAGSSLPPLVLAAFSAVVPELPSVGSAVPDRRHARGPTDASSSLQTLYCRRLR